MLQFVCPLVFFSQTLVVSVNAPMVVGARDASSIHRFRLPALTIDPATAPPLLLLSCN
jgi:hypothetical protein